MSWTAEEATVIFERLKAAAVGHYGEGQDVDMPVRQLRYEFRRRAIEWQRAAKELEGCDEGEAVISLICEIQPWMQVIGNQDEPWLYVVKVMHQGGQSSLMIDGPDGRPIYRNFHGPASPVVVRA